MGLNKRFALFTLVCAICALVIAPTAGAASYPVPKPRGGSKATQKATTKVGKKLQNATVSKLATSGLKVLVVFPKAGTISCTIKHAGAKIASGKVSNAKKGGKLLRITFNSAGQTFLQHGAGQKVTLSCTFKPKKPGRSVTSTVTVILG